MVEFFGFNFIYNFSSLSTFLIQVSFFVHLIKTCELSILKWLPFN